MQKKNLQSLHKTKKSIKNYKLSDKITMFKENCKICIILQNLRNSVKFPKRLHETTKKVITSKFLNQIWRRRKNS